MSRGMIVPSERGAIIYDRGWGGKKKSRPPLSTTTSCDHLRWKKAHCQVQRSFLYRNGRTYRARCSSRAGQVGVDKNYRSWVFFCSERASASDMATFYERERLSDMRLFTPRSVDRRSVGSACSARRSRVKKTVEDVDRPDGPRAVAAAVEAVAMTKPPAFQGQCYDFRKLSDHEKEKDQAAGGGCLIVPRPRTNVSDVRLWTPRRRSVAASVEQHVLSLYCDGETNDRLSSEACHGVRPVVAVHAVARGRGTTTISSDFPLSQWVGARASACVACVATQ